MSQFLDWNSCKKSDNQCHDPMDPSSVITQVSATATANAADTNNDTSGLASSGSPAATGTASGATTSNSSTQIQPSKGNFIEFVKFGKVWRLKNLGFDTP